MTSNESPLPLPPSPPAFAASSSSERDTLPPLPASSSTSKRRSLDIITTRRRTKREIITIPASSSCSSAALNSTLDEDEDVPHSPIDSEEGRKSKRGPKWLRSRTNSVGAQIKPSISASSNLSSASQRLSNGSLSDVMNGDKQVIEGGGGDEDDSIRSTASSEKQRRRFSLKGARANVTIFAKKGSKEAVRGERKEASEEAASSSTKGSITASYTKTHASSTSDLRSSTSSFQHLSPSPSTSSPPPVAARLGNWFSNILHSTTSTVHLESTPELPPADPPLHQHHQQHSSSSRSSVQVGGNTSNNGSISRSLNKSLPTAPGRLDRMLDRAAQFFLDSDSAADKCSDDIWVLGVRHDGFLPARASSPSSSSPPSPAVESLPTTINGWPITFYSDFYSRIALTYRSGFPPIPCTPASHSGLSNVMQSLSMSMGRGGGRTSEGLSSDTGWGCMLRTGQSLLANALLTVHLGRDWRKSIPPLTSPGLDPGPPAIDSSSPHHHAQYARLLSLFVDDPSPLAPFSVHRFALKGKQLGKDVGEWFGPSTAAGAITTLLNEFEPAGLGVANVLDGTIYKSEVETMSNNWQRPVLVLIGLRLGIDGVNSIYYESIKSIFSFPQSMGIAGGRPSSSYYFVGSQANSLFYIDPHHPRVALPVQLPPADLFAAAQSIPLSASSSTLAPEDFRDERQRLEAFFRTAYPDAALRSYHCDKVRKMALSSLDPSMLVGFLIRDEADWNDFSTRIKRVAEQHTPIIALADAPPSWMRPAPNATPRLSESARDSITSFSEPDDWDNESMTDGSLAHSSSTGVPGADKLVVVDRAEAEENWELDEGQSMSMNSMEGHDDDTIEDEESLDMPNERREESWHTAATAIDIPRRVATTSTELLRPRRLESFHSASGSGGNDDDGVMVAISPSSLIGGGVIVVDIGEVESGATKVVGFKT